MPSVSSHLTARALALISTGSVTKLKSVVRANRPIPIQMSEGKMLMNTTPASNTQETMLLEKDTTGTRALRMRSQA